MSEMLEYIDAYFNYELGENEKRQFEARCNTDETFAKEVAFYIAARAATQEALIEQKKEQWQNKIADKQKKPVKKSLVLRWMPYAAAACLILIMAFSFLVQLKAPEHLAAKYIKDNYNELQHTMDASKDSIQLGITEYNNKNFQHALALFEGVSRKDTTNDDAKKLSGIVYLQMEDYDKALERFQELSAMKNLHVNSGDILQATTLLLRDKTGDKEEAKGLLEKVVSENEEGNDLAREALKNW